MLRRPKFKQMCIICRFIEAFNLLKCLVSGVVVFLLDWILGLDLDPVNSNETIKVIKVTVFSEFIILTLTWNQCQHFVIVLVIELDSLKAKKNTLMCFSSVINIYTKWFRGFGVSNEEVPRRRCCWAERTKQETSRRLILSHIQSWSYSKKVALSLSLSLCGA